MPLTVLTESAIARPTRPGSAGARWRTFRPILVYEKCTKCNLCWKFCPDVAIDIDEMGWPWVDYDLCKGCGICAHECRPGALLMEREGLE